MSTILPTGDEENETDTDKVDEVVSSIRVTTPGVGQSAVDSQGRLAVTCSSSH